MIPIHEDIGMAFFKREVSPVQRFERALREKQAARQKLADRLSLAETALGEKRDEAERLAVAGAANAKLASAEARMRTFEDRAKTLRAALVEFDEQVVATERALADANASATGRPTRLRRWLQRSSRPPRDLAPGPPHSWKPSQKAWRRCRKRPCSRPAWTRCGARFSRPRT
jgi:hypothetical protein